ncbi:transglutaminaseTgpA domain-containing protein [Actinoplanes sp. CA-051413]|uniref:transglutaminase family protein n=1 Tax=Actinoplanes sp. CA-051413 TaxID=3239899 RepID=UPI003D9691BA
MTVRMVCVVLAAAFAGMLFAPVFGVAALLVPVGVPAAAVLLAVLACGRFSVVDWRPVLALLAGVLAVVETVLWRTTAAGLPTGATLRALVDGAGDSWRLVLQSTWPARPDPALLLFVPLLVVLAAVLGAELLHRLRSPLPALLPSLTVVALSQLYFSPAPGPATLAALAYAALGATLLFDGPAVRVVPAAVTAVVAAVAAALVLPSGPARYSLARDQAAPLPDAGLTSPLDEVTGRLGDPSRPVFRVRDATDVDRWPVVVLEDFDGVNWTPAGRFRRLGATLPPGPAVTVPAVERTATIELAAGEGPWLPSQTWPARAEGVEPLVAEHQGTLLLPGTAGGVRYDLSWWQPRSDAGSLAEAAIDPDAPGGLHGIGTVPPQVEALAGAAVHGNRPSFATAVALEEWFRANHDVAIGRELPAGHAWPQLTDFLLTTRRGTSEQFAAAYVALARILGIPARLVVGYRMPAQADPDGFVTVRNGDALVWPEVAVRDVGWVPLDPTGGAAESGAAAGNGLAGLAERARQTLPAPGDLRDPPLAAPAGPAASGERSMPWLALLALPVVPLVGWPLAVPLAWGVRSWRRRRRPGPSAVVGAWEEVRDRLRAYGVPVSTGMTVRDLGTAAAAITDAGTVAEIRRLGVLVDQALWSGAAPVDQHAAQAWSIVRAVRRGLARTGRRRWLRALLDHRGLRRPG